MDFKSFGEWAFKPNNSPGTRSFLTNPFHVFARRASSSSDRTVGEPLPQRTENLGHDDSVHQPYTPEEEEEEAAAENLSGDDEMAAQLDDMQMMLLEKQSFPGAEKWAEDEERLFEILYLRETTPLMPHHWTIDFAGAPMPENVFDDPETERTIIRAISEPEFSVTQAIEKMMYLTGDVVAAFESGLVGKPQKMINKSLGQFLNTLANDAGYAHLEIVPNIFVEPITGLIGEHITTYMQNRMKTLAGLQRDFYKEDRSAKFWEEVAPAAMSIKAEKARLLHQLLMKKKRTISEALEQEADELDAALSHSEQPMLDEARKKRRRLNGIRPPLRDVTDEDRLDAVCAAAELAKDDSSNSSIPVKAPSKQKAEMRFGSDTPIRPRPSQFSQLGSPPPGCVTSYRRTPPVIYGLFAMGASVFLLTVDSSEERDPFVTYHLSLDFSDPEQAVWNALTIAIVGCRARDEISGRLQDFEPKVVGEETDPDE